MKSQNEINQKNLDIKINNTNEKTQSKNKKCYKNFIIFKDFKNLFIQFLKFIRKVIKNFKRVTNLSLKSQGTIITLILIIISELIYVLFKTYILNKILKYEFVWGYKRNVFYNIIEKLNTANIKISNYKAHFQFKESISNLMFIHIYNAEMINHKILEEPSITSIKNFSEEMYENISFKNYNYTIGKEEVENYLDNNNSVNNLQELLKLYFVFLPNIALKYNEMGNKFLESFLIVYEYNETTLNYSDLQYFNFPKEVVQICPSHNFINDNMFTEPFIANDYVSVNNENGEDFFRENWFYEKDYEFRKTAKHTISSIDIENYHKLLGSKLNRAYFLNLHLYFSHNNKSFIYHSVNLFQFTYFTLNTTEYFLFVMENSTKNAMENFKKFSDNSTFLVTSSSINAISLSENFQKYFNFGMKRNNSLFFFDGQNYETFDVELFNQIEKYYTTIKIINSDIKIFTTLYFYTMFFQRYEALNDKSNYNKEVFSLFNYTNKNDIESICSEIDYDALYNEVQYIINRNFDKEFYIYDYLYKSQEEKNELLDEFKDFPYCITVPFYCIEKSYFKDKKIVYKKEINLPKKCYVDIQGFNINSNTTDNDLSISIEYQNLDYLRNLSFISFALINGSEEVKNQRELKNKIEKLNNFILIITSFFSMLLFISIFILLKVKYFRFTNIIFKFEKKFHENYFMYNSEKKKEKNNLLINNLNNNYEDNNNNKNQIDENSTLLSLNSKKAIDNSLLDELFIIFCDFYNFNPENYFKNIEKRDAYYIKKAKYKIIKKKNELFYLLALISEISIKFKLNVNISNLNLYENAKLNIKFLKDVVNIHDKKNIESTQNILYEILSTEIIEDYGLILNLRFNYLSYNKNNYNLFSIKKVNFDTDYIKNNSFNNNDMKTVKLYGKKNFEILSELEKFFEDDDYLKLENLKKQFDTFLINVYDKYINQIYQETNNKK